VRGSNPGGGEIFHTCPDRPWGPPSFLHNGYRVFPRGKERPGRDVDPSPPSSAVVKKEYSYISAPPMGRTACTEPQSPYKGALLPHFQCELIRMRDGQTIILIPFQSTRALLWRFNVAGNNNNVKKFPMWKSSVFQYANFSGSSYTLSVAGGARPTFDTHRQPHSQ